MCSETWSCVEGDAWQGPLAQLFQLPVTPEESLFLCFSKTVPAADLLTKHLQPGKNIALLKLHYERLSAREGAQRLAPFSQCAEVCWCHHLGHGAETTAATV